MAKVDMPTGDNKTPEKKKVEKVITGTATVKKKSPTRKFADVFISEDAHSVKSYLFGDVVVPALKKLLSDLVKDGIEMLLYGSSGRRDNRSDRFRGDYVTYTKYSDRRDDRGYSSSHREARDYNDIVLNNRGDAETVLLKMDEVIEAYGVVTIADLYEFVGVTGHYTDNKYGWMNLRNAEVVRVRDGYLLKFPKAAPLD